MVSTLWSAPAAMTVTVTGVSSVSSASSSRHATVNVPAWVLVTVRPMTVAASAGVTTSENGRWVTISPVAVAAAQLTVALAPATTVSGTTWVSTRTTRFGSAPWVASSPQAGTARSAVPRTRKSCFAEIIVAPAFEVGRVLPIPWARDKAGLAPPTDQFGWKRPRAVSPPRGGGGSGRRVAPRRSPLKLDFVHFLRRRGGAATSGAPSGSGWGRAPSPRMLPSCHPWVGRAADARGRPCPPLRVVPAGGDDGTRTVVVAAATHRGDLRAARRPGSGRDHRGTPRRRRGPAGGRERGRRRRDGRRALHGSAGAPRGHRGARRDAR